MSIAQIPSGAPATARFDGAVIVTPDMEASLRLYRDALGHALIDEGERDGRRHVLLGMDSNDQSPTIGLIETSPDAPAIRPRTEVGIVDPGLVAIACRTSDWQAAFRQLAGAPVDLIAPPVCTMIGDLTAPDRVSMIFSVIGPAGEQLVIRCVLGEAGQTPDLFGPFDRAILACRDRWPVIDFYAALFDFETIGDTAVGEDIVNFRSVNCALGTGPGSYFRFGELGPHKPIEWREYRQWRPSAEATCPTSLDHAGLAMINFTVSDPATVRTRALAAAIPIEVDGLASAIIVRGPLGELIGVTGDLPRN